MVKSPPVYPSSSMENGSSTLNGLPNAKNKEMNHDAASGPLTDTNELVTVCCGCRPKAKRRNRKFRKIETEPSPGKKLWKRTVSSIKQRNWRYRDADIGNDSQWMAFSQNRDARSIKSSEGGDDDDFMYFFDAVDRPLGDDEYPIDGYAIGAQKFKVVFTTSIQSPSPKASLSDPDSMLRLRSRSSSLGSMSSLNDEFEDAYDLEPIETPNRKIQNHKEPSARFKKIKRRSCEELEAELTRPRSSTIENAIGLAGYPGTLTVEELEECQKFVKKLNALPSAVSEQIYSMRDVEEQPYTICRWLRATKFDAEAILNRCVENQPMFEEAREHDFYGPDLEDHLGCPFSVFLSQYPFLSIGRGKNGSPVNYFNVGKINPEGIMCLITMDKLKSYFWYSFMYNFKDKVRESQAVHPDFSRCEGINILDLNGLSSSALTTETMEVIKICAKISDFFPETLHCMLVLNAPSFFTFSWKLIKNFIDPRTASRIQLFSSREKGQKAMELLIDKQKQIPFDYGGGNMSLEEAFLKECSDSEIVRQDIELLHCRRRGKKGLQKTWILKADENIEIAVYTRSVSKASLEVILNGSVIKTVHAQCSFVEEEGGTGKSTPHPRKTLLMTSLAGPGEVNVEAKDLDTPVSKAHASCSRGYFLVVGDVKKQISKKHISRARHGGHSASMPSDLDKRKFNFVG